MSVQSVYKERMDAGRAGMVADTTDATFLSRDVETVAGIAFGVPAAQGAADKGIRVAATDDTAIVGIVVRERSVDPSFPNGFRQRDSARVMIKGAIFVEVSAAVSAGDPVYVTANGGAFSGASGAGKFLVPNAIFETSAAQDALAVVRLK